MGGYDPAMMDWSGIAPGLFDDDVDGVQNAAWLDDGGIFDVIEPPLPPVIIRGDDGGFSRRERFWRAQAEEWFEAQYGKIEAATTARAKRRLATRITADVPEFISGIPELAPRVTALETIAARFAEPAPDYTALANAVAAQMALIEAWQTKERRRRDMEAILVLGL